MLRHDLLRFPLPDGGLELLDLLLERAHRFTADEARLLKATAIEDPALLARLNQGLLLEGPVANALRQGVRHGRTRSKMPPPDHDEAQGPWELAETLPDFVTPHWRDPERWRRLAEARTSGQLLMRAEGFMALDHAEALRQRASALPFEREDSAYVRGEGRKLAEGELADVVAHFQSGPLHALISAVMHQALPERIFARVWRLGPGDAMAVHRDGLHYATTFSIGLCPDWTAQHGGAIAFGIPNEAGLEVTERWLPHAGDLLLFQPTALAWHAVEPVVRGERMTFTGHYVTPSYPG